MRNFAIKSDATGDYPTWCRMPSDVVNSFTLAAGVARSATVPALAGKVFFSCTTNYYVKYNGTAAVPGDVSDGSASELNPACYVVAPGSTLGIIAPANGVITLSYYR